MKHLVLVLDEPSYELGFGFPIFGLFDQISHCLKVKDYIVKNVFISHKILDRHKKLAQFANLGKLDFCT